MTRGARSRHGPDLRSTRLKPPIHANVAATIQLNAGLLKSDSGGVRNPPHRDQYVAAIDGPAFSAASRFFDLNGEADRARKRQKSAIIAADV